MFSWSFSLLSVYLQRVYVTAAGALIMSCQVHQVYGSYIWFKFATVNFQSEDTEIEIIATARHAYVCSNQSLQEWSPDNTVLVVPNNKYYSQSEHWCLTLRVWNLNSLIFKIAIQFWRILNQSFKSHQSKIDSNEVSVWEKQAAQMISSVYTTALLAASKQL